MRCSDGRYYVVKFQNNPQGIRILANDLMGTMLAAELGLPVPRPAFVSVDSELIRWDDDLNIQYPCCKIPCLPGLCFGSSHPMAGDTVKEVHDVFLFCHRDHLSNPDDFLGMLVFDKWTGNTDHREVIVVQEDSRPVDSPYYSYRALMIDQGHCFDGSRWCFPDKPRSGLFPCGVYRNVGGIEAFEPWLQRLENVIDRNRLERIADEIPPEWYQGDVDALKQLVSELDQRRTKVRSLLLQTRQAAPDFFPNWKCDELARRVAAD